jgi:hypothetical protein
MKFRIEQWTIEELIACHTADNLDLSPPYQRRFIWSLEDQRILIESISKNYPFPNIFLKEVNPGKFEVVDGQQRTRTIISFRNGDFEDFSNKKFSEADYPEFDNFKISVIIIEEIADTDISIEGFYGLVNSAGVHLNRPEIKKAEYYDTQFLKLINACNDYQNFKDLGLFTDTVLKRMNDMDFVSEIIVLLKDGITDKKETIDKTFEEDITAAQHDELYNRFTSIVDGIVELNELFLIRKTRYKQKNDFYTLFGFLNDNPLPSDYRKYIYKILVLIAIDITPSNEDCIPFQNYARNCVTQSNSKTARLERKLFLENLFLNQNPEPNPAQREILNFYEMRQIELVEHDIFFTIDLDYLMSQKPSILFNA